MRPSFIRSPPRRSVWRPARACTTSNFCSTTRSAWSTAGRTRSAPMRIVEITYTPVKGLGLLHPAQVDLTATGAANDRRFFLADKRLQMVNGKRYGQLVQ